MFRLLERSITLTSCCASAPTSGLIDIHSLIFWRPRPVHGALTILTVAKTLSRTSSLIIFNSTLQKVTAFRSLILKYLLRRRLLVVYCLYLVGAMDKSVDSPPRDRIAPRKILVVDGLQGESVSGSVG